MDHSIAEDRLRGVHQIAAELGETPRRTYHLQGIIPASKQGRLWVASRHVLKQQYLKTVGGQAARVA
jgi:hypothetical protein